MTLYNYHSSFKAPNNNNILMLVIAIKTIVCDVTVPGDKRMKKLKNIRSLKAKFQRYKTTQLSMWYQFL